jgi:hypothetical protein
MVLLALPPSALKVLAKKPVLLVLPSLALTTPSRKPSSCQRLAKQSCLFCRHWHLLPPSHQFDLPKTRQTVLLVLPSLALTTLFLPGFDSPKTRQTVLLVLLSLALTAPFPPGFDSPKTCQTVLLVLPSLAFTTPFPPV